MIDKLKPAFLALALFGTASMLAACEEEGSAEKAGAAMDEAAEDMGDAWEDMTK
ncbi:MAG: hypothetical protein ACPG06_11325 [Alphaproteobacteria bacterium]